ncbi:MAG: glycosyltransferase, partial [Planctomycetes bacterium]|nr:glycosyltransferase [Planctomycetota bacterium]
AIVVPSRWTAGRVLALAPQAPEPVVVGNGVDVPPSVTGSLPRPAPANGYVLHIGHVEPRKNLGVVVEALARLPADTRPELWLAGHDAGALASLRAQSARRGVALVALGAVPEATLHALYAAARTVVVPSLHEGFGLPALEAIAHNRPLLVAAAGALPEVSGPCAPALPPHDPTAWATALGSAPAIQDAAANSAWLRQFRWADAARQLLQVWRRAGG